MPVFDTDVIIVGAAPTGLTLAAELGSAGVRPLVLERLPRVRDIPKAGGLGGQILHLLRYRGLIERFEAASGHPRPTPRFPFGGLHIDFSGLDESPMQALRLPQPDLERLLADIACEFGADIRRGHEVVSISQDAAAVSADVHGPEGPYRVTARYLVGCDGAHSPVREMAGIPFPGMSYPEVNRLGHFTMPDSVTLRDDGDYEIRGVGLLRAGFTRTGRGEFAIASYTPNDLGVYTNEDEGAEAASEYDDDAPMTVAEFQASIRRVLGAEIPLGMPTRLTRFTFHARHAQRYRQGRVFVAGDAAHLFPAPGVAVNAGMMDAVNLAWKLAADVGGWAPDGLLDTYHDERHLAATRTLLHTQAQVALRRGHDPAAEALRNLFSELVVDEQPLRRMSALIAGCDVRYPMPGSGHHALAGTFAPDVLAAPMHTTRPVLLDLADRADLRVAAGDWSHRVEVARTDPNRRPADALLIRPDGQIAWAAGIDESADTAVPTLRVALSRWFGAADG